MTSMAGRLAKPGMALEGIAWSVVAVACFAVSDTIAKFVTNSASVLVALWFRYAIQTFVMSVLMLPVRGMAAFKTAHPKFQILRGLLLVVTTLLAFLSLSFMPVGEFTAIVLITPLVITLLAGKLLGETVSPLRWVLVAGGLVGAMVIIRPGHEAFHWASLLPLALVGTNAWFQVLTSKLAKTEDPMTMQLYTGWTGAVVSNGVAVCMDIVASMAAARHVGGDGLFGDRRSFHADFGLPARPSGDVDTVFLFANLLRDAGRLGRVCACAGCLGDCRHGADWRLRCGGWLVDGL